MISVVLQILFPSEFFLTKKTVSGVVASLLLDTQIQPFLAENSEH